MDFLDPRKVRRHRIMLFVGYGLIAIAIAATAMVLLYQSSGYGINSQGEVIQHGLIFTGSQPSGARIYIDGQDSGFSTNKRLLLVSGQYVFQFKRDGYRQWSRSLDVQGGSVNRLDFAFLFPKTLDSAAITKFDQAPTLTTQSPDRRWLVVQSGADERVFSVYDLKSPTTLPVTLTLPASVYTAGKTSSSWQLVGWSNDNVHVLLKHLVDGKTEFILLNRKDVTQSLNLNATLGVNPTDIELNNLKYDQYYIFDQAAGTLRTASLGQPTPLDYLTHVVAFKSYGDNQMLYVSDDTKQSAADDNQLAVKFTDGNQTYTIRKLSRGTHYLLDTASYNGDLYIVAGVDSENKAIVYRNPIDQIKNPDIGVAVPVSTLRVTSPNFVAFSDSARYVAVENGNGFAVYDAEASKTTSYTLKQPFDAPQEHAVWMDGNRLAYVSKGKLLVFEADDNNLQELMAVTPGYEPAFTPDYKQVLTMSPRADNAGLPQLEQTWLLIPADR